MKKLLLVVCALVAFSSAGATTPASTCPEGTTKLSPMRNPPPCSETREQWLRNKKNRSPAEIGFYVQLLVVDLERCNMKYADVGETKQSLCRYQWEYWKRDWQKRRK